MSSVQSVSAARSEDEDEVFLPEQPQTVVWLLSGNAVTNVHTSPRLSSLFTVSLHWSQSHLLFFIFFFLWTIFNTSLLQTYIHGALEDMRLWYNQHFVSHKHGMNEQTGKIEVDESINLQKNVCKAPTWKRSLNMSSSS